MNCGTCPSSGVCFPSCAKLGQQQVWADPPHRGWICPRCNKVHAPSVQGCNCNAFGPRLLQDGLTATSGGTTPQTT